MKIKLKKDMWQIPVILVLFAFSISLFNMAGYIFSGMIVMMLLFDFGKLRIGIMEIMLFLFSAFYFLVYTFNYGVTVESIILFLIGPWSAYLFGKTYVYNFNDKKAFIKLILVLCVGMFLHGILNWIAYINSSHMETYNFYRRSVDIWRGTIVNVNTTGMYYTFLTGVCLGVLFTNLPKKYKIGAVIVLLASVAATVFFASRTLLFIVGIIFVWKGVLWLFSNRVSNKSKIVVVFIGILLGIFILISLAINLGGINNLIASLKIVQRISDGEVSSRWNVWLLFFEDMNFIKYLFGGGHLVEGTSISYLHNLWLDVYNSVGIFPFVLLLIFTVMLWARFKKFKRTMCKKGLNTEFTIFQCLTIAIVLNCMVEPIIEANPYYFLIALMFFGAMEARTHTVQIHKKGCL